VDGLMHKLGKLNISDFVFTVAMVILFLAPEHALFSQVANVFLALFLAITVFERRGDFKLHAIAVIFFMFSFMCLVSCLYSISPADSLGRTKTTFQMLIPICGCMNYFSLKENMDKFINIYIFASLISCAYMFVMEDIFSGNPVGTSIANQNQVATRLALAMVFILFRLFSEFKWWKLLVLGISVLFIILSGSRSALVVTLVSALFMVVLSVKSRRRGGGLVLVGSLAFIMITIYLIFNVEILYNVIGVRLEGVMDFFNSGVGESSVNARAELIATGWERFEENPIFGTGFNSFKSMSKESVGRIAYSHNNYLELLVGIGLVGTFIYYLIPFMLIFCSLKLLMKEGQTSLYGALCFSLTAGILVSDMFTVNYHQKTMIMVLAFVYSVYLVKKEELI